MGGVFQFQGPAQQAMSKMAWDYYDSGALDEITLRRNRIAFEQILMRPRMLRDVTSRDMRTTILGAEVDAPVLVAPMAFQRLAHGSGEAATATAAAGEGVGMVLSTLSTTPGSEVASRFGGEPLWFQLYVHKDRGLTRELVSKAEEEGFTALCVTVDAPLLGRRERDEANAFSLPPEMNLEVLGALSSGQVSSGGAGSGLFAYFLQQIDASLTWKDLEWLAGITRLPVIPKGILHPTDARIAAEAGAPALVVSNHGGRQLDTAVSTIEALPAIRDAVASSSVELYIDGGVRRGTDIVKAIALGARGILVGRPILWGLAVNGAAGAQAVLRILKDELDLAMALTGCRTIEEIDESIIFSNGGPKTA